MVTKREGEKRKKQEEEKKEKKKGDLGRAIFGRAAARSFGTTQSTTRHEMFWVVPARYEHEGRAVLRISSRWAVWHDSHFEPCLGRHGMKIAHRSVCSPLFCYDS